MLFTICDLDHDEDLSQWEDVTHVTSFVFVILCVLISYYQREIQGYNYGTGNSWIMFNIVLDRNT